MRIDVNNLSFAYTQKYILHNLSFSLNSGDFLTLSGKNGTGKSTLIKCLLKIVKVPNNTIFFDGVDINTINRFQHVGYVPQKVEFSYEFPITVSEILSSSYNKRKDEYFTKVVNTLNINPFYRDNINNISGGQFQRVSIARALLNRPRILILDEPTVGIDDENVNSIFEILKMLKKNKVTILLSTHNLDLTEELSDYRLELDEVGDYKFIQVKK